MKLSTQSGAPAPVSVFEVAERMLQDITNDVYHPGEWLRQNDLAKHYGCTRLAIRQVLETLSLRGVVVHIPDRGYFVREFTPEEINHFIEVRILIEASMVDSIFDNVDDNAIEDLTNLADKFEGAVDQQDYQAAQAFNINFHERYMDLCDNKVMVRLVRDLRNHLPHAAYRRKHNVLIMRRAVKHHFAIIKALKQGAKTELKRVLRRHAELLLYERLRN